MISHRLQSGLAIVLPIIITAWIVHWAIAFCIVPAEQIILDYADISPSWSIHIILMVFLSMLFFCIALFIGYIHRTSTFHRWMRHIEAVINIIPIISTIYSAFRHIIDLFISVTAKTGTHVVWTSTTSSGPHTLGIVTNSLDIHFEHEKQPMHVVFIAGTPNPTVGLLLLKQVSAVIPTTTPPEQALAWIISCGMANAHPIMSSIPSQLQKNRFTQ